MKFVHRAAADGVGEKRRREAAAWFARLRGPDAAAHRPAFDRWRRDRPDRQAVYDRLVRRWDDAAILRGSRQDFGLAARNRGRSLGSGWLWGAAPVAAALALAVYLLPTRPAWIDAAAVPSAWSERAATAVGTIRTVKLPDGSSVILDTGSVVRWRFTAGSRRLALLRGRARFAVARSPNRPFVVAAGDGVVTAHGTVFDVALTQPGQVAVTLLRGVVEVDEARRAGLLRQTTLAAGQQLAYGQDLPAPQLTSPPPDTLTWPTGLLAFASTPLSQAVAEANRYSKTPIRLAGADLASLRVSGVFRAGAARPLADSLAATFDLRVEPEADGALVLGRPALSSAP